MALMDVVYRNIHVQWQPKQLKRLRTARGDEILCFGEEKPSIFDFKNGFVQIKCDLGQV